MFYMHENAKCLIFKFSKVNQQHTWGVVGNLISVLLQIVLFAAVKEFCKSTKNWQSYSHGYGDTFFDSRCIR